jgi:hypothetical protein
MKTNTLQDKLDQLQKLYDAECETTYCARLQIENLNRAVSILSNAGEDLAEECESVSHVNNWDRARDEANRLSRASVLANAKVSQPHGNNPQPL